MRRFGFVFGTVTIVVGLGLVLLYNGGLRGWTTLRDAKTPQCVAPSWARYYRDRIESSDRDLVRLTKGPFSVRLCLDSAYTWPNACGMRETSSPPTLRAPQCAGLRFPRTRLIFRSRHSRLRFVCAESNWKGTAAVRSYDVEGMGREHRFSASCHAS